MTPAVVTWHPAHVLRNARWTEVFRADVARAFRHATGTLTWTEPRCVFNPTLGQLDGLLDAFSRERFVGCDAETEPAPHENFDPETDLLRCVALGTKRIGMSVGFRSVPRQPVPTPWLVPPTIAAERVCNFFSRCVGQPRGPLLVMHNGNTYDRPVLARHRMPLPDYGFVVDTLPLARAAWSELGHKLDFLQSWLTDAPKHKGRDGESIDHEAWASDEELATYCITDVAVDLHVLGPLLAQVRKTEQGRVYKSDVQMQRFAVGAHRAGMQIDEEQRRWHAARLAKTMRMSDEAAQAAARAGGRRKPINLASVPQVRGYLYDHLGLPWQVDDEEDEDPSTDRDAIYELLQIVGLPEHARRFCEALLEYRGAARALCKDVLKVGEVPDYLQEWLGEKKAGKERKAGLRIGIDGRVHPTWSAMGVTGRPQSSDPNVSNVPDRKRDVHSLRSMYVAAPGCVLVGADLEQVELRAVAALSGDEIWLDLFRRQERGEKLDLHKINASVYFDGKSWQKIEPYERDFSKILTYMYLYGGGATRAMLNMRLVRNPETGVRPYAQMTLTRAREARNKLLKVHHWLTTWWERTVQEWREHRQLREPILGRVRYFLDGEGGDRGEGEQQRSELINFRAQSAVAGHMSGAGVVGAVMTEIGWPWEGRLRGLGGAGLIHHGYDSLIVEVAADKAQQAAAILERAMASRWCVNGNEIAIPAKVKVGLRWSEMT